MTEAHQIASDILLALNVTEELDVAGALHLTRQYLGIGAAGPLTDAVTIALVQASRGDGPICINCG